MSLPIASLLILIAVPWILIAGSWRFRNWRAVGVVLLGTAAILVAGMLPRSIAPIVQLVPWIAAMGLLLFRGDAVGVMSPDEYLFVERYLAILDRVDTVFKRALVTEFATSLAKLEAAVADLEGLPAFGEWADLRRDTAIELRRRVTMIKAAYRENSPDRKQLRDDRWRAIEQQFRALMKRRASFWQGWPHIRTRELR